jgi:hypothetical protein
MVQEEYREIFWEKYCKTKNTFNSSHQVLYLRALEILKQQCHLTQNVIFIALLATIPSEQNGQTSFQMFFFSFSSILRRFDQEQLKGVLTSQLLACW